MKKFIGIILFLFMFFLGCTLNPNKNLLEARCCYQSDKIYSCALSEKAVEKTTDLFELLDCGTYKGTECKYFNKSSGEILDKDKKTIFYEGTSMPIRPNECSNNCNFDKANCTNEDQKNTCYSLSNKKITYPICVNASSFSCIQNDCKGWVCGEKKAKVKKEFSFSSDEQKKLEESYKKSGGSDTKSSVLEVSKGLVGKVCEFRTMNESTFRLLSEQFWTVNTLKLGILGSFSDFEVARHYFPPSDVFCTASFAGGAVVDKFLNYLQYSGGSLKKLNVFNSDYKAPLYFCKENQTHYFCAANPVISFPKTSTYARQLCFNFCSKLFDKSLFKPYFFYKINVTPPFYKPEIEHYALNSSAYIAALEREYPEKANDYYRKEGEEGVGPEGAKVFECISPNDCLSSRCLKDEYLRAKCFLQDGSSILCNCSLFESCEEAFSNCKVDKSIDQETCVSGLNLCKIFSNSQKSPVVLCKYSPTTYNLFAYLDYAKKSLFILNKHDMSRTVAGMDSWDGVWGVYDFDEFNKYKRIENGQKQQVEFANIVKKVNEYGCLNDSGREIIQPNCPSGFWYVSESKKCVNKNGQQANPTCPSNLIGPQEWVVWKDNIDILSSMISRLSNQDDRNNEMRWDWRRAFIVVPQFQLVSFENSNQAFLITSRNVEFKDLKNKLPFIEVCGLRSTDNINNFNDPNFDILEISTQKIPLSNHSLIEKFVKPIPFHPYYMVGEKGEFLFDKIWVIKSLGKCKKEEKLNVLKTRSYGICDSCGTFLTLAYQSVKSTSNSYCPSGCSKSSWNNCVCYDPIYSSFSNYKFKEGQGGTQPAFASIKTYSKFIVNLPESSPSTVPEFGYLISKIKQYLENNVIPVLDLKEYSKSGIELGGRIISSNQKELETLENFECIEGSKVCSCTQKNSEDVCIKWLCSCNFETLPDLLFLFLNSKYSATISILDKLSSSEASARVNNAKTLCPSCVIALEHEPLLKIKNDTNLTQLYFSGANSLNSSISNYFKVQFPQKEEDWGFPPKFLNNEAQARLKNVDIIVLNLDLSDKAPSSDLKEKKKYYLDTAKKAAQVSRYILIHVGKPSIWKLRFPTNKAFSDTAYFDPIFFDNLFSIEQELTLSGVVGVLLPSLFEKDENVLNTVDEVTSNKFINLVNGSLSFLQFSADSSTLLINAKDKSCADLCSECPLSDKSLCKSECDDGSSCPNGQCPQNCISISYCSNNLCEEKFKTKKIVCYYMPSKQKYYENIKRFELNSMEELISNYDFPTIVGSLNQKCCINISSKEKEAYYTFFSHPIFSYHAEEAVYPHFGANTTSCGKTVIENVEQQQCDPKAPPELSYSSTLYYCYWADK